jgi:hypothetical protein
MDDTNKRWPETDGLSLRHTVHAMTLAEFEKTLMSFGAPDMIKFLIKVFPQYVKNKTFNLRSGGHRFHSISGYIPIKVNSIQRMQLSLVPKKLTEFLKTIRNHMRLYKELRDIMNDDNMCPCELIAPRRKVVEEFTKEYDKKGFDDRPQKMARSDDLDRILLRYKIDLRRSASRSKSIKRTLRNTPTHHGVLKPLDSGLKLNSMVGLTIDDCQHEYLSLIHI